MHPLSKTTLETPDSRLQNPQHQGPKPSWTQHNPETTPDSGDTSLSPVERKPTCHAASWSDRPLVLRLLRFCDTAPRALTSIPSGRPDEIRMRWISIVSQLPETGALVVADADQQCSVGAIVTSASVWDAAASVLAERCMRHMASGGEGAGGGGKRAEEQRDGSGHTGQDAGRS